jgi:hypothetical protein
MIMKLILGQGLERHDKGRHAVLYTTLYEPMAPAGFSEHG